MTMNTLSISTPVGRNLILAEEDGKLCICRWAEPGCETDAHTQNTIIVENPVLAQTIKELDEYFAGKRKSFDIECEPQGTPFRLRVWHELRRISYGTTVTYKQLAQAVGCPKGVRAVANACGANPISIILPCHRVIGSNGCLTGYAGGIEVKRRLLGIEHISVR